METNFKSGDLVRIKSGARAGQIGKIVEKCSERQDLYQVEFPNDPATAFFFEEELEKAGGIPCPKCIEGGKWTQLSEPYWTEEGWAEDCPVHGQLYLWGWYRVEAGEVIDLLTGKSLKL
jgi:hypothetical protein